MELRTAWSDVKRTVRRPSSRPRPENEFNFKNCSNLHFGVKCIDDISDSLRRAKVDFRGPHLRGDERACCGRASAGPEDHSAVLLRAGRRAAQTLRWLMHQSRFAAMVLQGGPDMRVELLDRPAGYGMPWQRRLKVACLQHELSLQPGAASRPMMYVELRLAIVVFSRQMLRDDRRSTE